MHIPANESFPLPDDLVLAEMAATVRDSGDWSWIVDREWRVVYMTDEHRASFAAGVGMVPVPQGEFLFGQAFLEATSTWVTGLNRPELWGSMVRSVGGLALTDLGASAAELRAEMHPDLRPILDGVQPTEATSTSFEAAGEYLGKDFRVRAKVLRIQDDDGATRGRVFLFQPAVGMGVIGSMSFALDPGHLERMVSVARASRTPSAMLFADVEGSSALSRTLSTANFFALGRRIVRATDQCVVDAGGLVGRHVGDGVVAFFPVKSYDSESGAALACIRAARAVQEKMTEVAERSRLDPDALVMRFGLHWGSTVYLGNVTTAGRFEVTAQGDEVNETARIEACATGGRILASKPLMERLDARAAEEFGIDLDHLTYTQLSDLASATEKARRDAPAVAVCEL